MTTPATKTIDPELKSALDALRAGIAAAAPAAKLTALQAQVDAIDTKMATRIIGDSSFGRSTLLATIQQNEGIARLLKDRRGTAVLHLKAPEYRELMDQKSIISSTVAGTSEGDPLTPVGVSTTGVLQIDRIPGITPEARQALRVRSVLPSRPTTMSSVDFVKVSTPLSPGSPGA
jgi:hypothetical protein